MRFLITRLAITLFAALGFAVSVANVFAQDQGDFQRQLDSGEFPAAMSTAQAQADPAVRDQMFSQLAQAQRFANTGLSPFATAAMIEGDSLRFGTLDQLTNYNLPPDEAGFGGQSGGQGGGITEQDFDELMDLIQETIDPDSWEENGGTGRMRPFPSGVYVDSSGTMKKILRDSSGRLDAIREVQPGDIDNAGVLQQSELRKISLSRLERQLQVLAATGQDVPDDLQNLAGIFQLQFVMLYPETGDVVIAGPAGPWHYDEIGRAINTATGNPVLNLDDLVVCLRNARHDGGQFGCSIDPREERLVAAKQFLATTSLTGDAWRDRLRDTLGQQDVTINGINPTSHAARVIVEADYRMKLIGMGVEESVPGLKNYFDRLHLDEQGNPPSSDLVRWWFTMNYDSVSTNADRTIFELNGQGVKLLSESEFWDEQGRRVHTGQSSAATRGFAEDFTGYFPELASKYPIYSELKNLFDCAIAASLIHNEGMARSIDWRLSFLDGSQRPGVLTYQLAAQAVPRHVDSITGQRIIRHREGNRTLRHTIVGISGGVVFDSRVHASRDKVRVVDTGVLTRSRQESRPLEDSESWAWD